MASGRPDNGAVFTAEIPSDLTDESGKKISSEILESGRLCRCLWGRHYAQSYPGQYPGVSKMVVTGEGSEDELKQYQDVIDMVFAEPDTSEVPSAGVVVQFIPWTDHVIDERTGELYMDSSTLGDSGNRQF